MSAELRHLVVREYGWVCHLCKHDISPVALSGPWSLHIDHVVPRSRGGCNCLRNLRPSHRRCNQAKGAVGPRVYCRRCKLGGLPATDVAAELRASGFTDEQIRELAEELWREDGMVELSEVA